ncbi:putative mitochondrial chaperone BCS1-B [Hypsizygus marmoreus]|uniref:Mitochondrial chaperone BCS1-B n=1 Tax=Hypsizygus marmoreus TaxID=39966 RepID=A0A369JZF7_HYPMA|nr:putative mitochondrial chaperone BCS1-B [Hypsizygus marmoreus]
MASYLPLLQQFFSSTNTSSSLPSPSPPPPASIGNATTDFPTSISALLTFLVSFSALREWLKLIVVGGILESCRRLLMAVYNKFTGSFFISASFDQNDASYNWILVWLAKQPSWSRTRDVQISTKSFGSNSPAVELDGEEDRSNEFFKSSRKISFLPSASLTYTLWYRGRWMSVTRVQSQAGIYGDKENTLYIRILSRDHKILTELLQEARRYYMAGQENNMCVYVSDSSNRWNHVACRARRSMRSIVLDPGIKEVLVEDAQDFLNSKSWYAERGIPFRRGYLLYGAPGSGKTSMIHCMAGELGLDVYILSLSRAGLDDASLSELVNALPERCVALMEDIDAAFTHGVSRGEDDSDDSEGAGSSKEGGKDKGKEKDKDKGGEKGTTTTTSKLSLSGLLNALDGVGAQEGRILFATTNRYAALDPALCRPGRMDLHIEFRNASRYQARELFERFYLPSEGVGEEKDKGKVENGKDKVENGKDEEVVEETEKEGGDSGYGSDADQQQTKNEKGVLTPTEPSALTGATHTGRAPPLSRPRILSLAEQFAGAIPERECSMASLQGYLMTYKTRPVQAAREARVWVEKERERRKKREGKWKGKEEGEKVEEVENKDVEKNGDVEKRDDEIAEIKTAKSTQKAAALCVACGAAADIDEVVSTSLQPPTPVSPSTLSRA